jgi:hypothetical protein
MHRIVLLLPAAASFAAAQASLGSHPILLNGDMAVLESGEARTDLACTVIPVKPALGFDLKFHSGYDLQIPMRELVGAGNLLSILFRVIPKNGSGTPTYFNHQIRVPAISDDKGTVTLQGAFDVGEGDYHIDWMAHDFGGRFCSTSWDTQAELSWKDKQVAMALPSNTVRETEDEKFQPEPPVERTQAVRLNIKVLMNFAPDRPGSPTLDPADRVALISILRNISRSPQIGKFSLVAFNIQEQRVLFRQDAADHIDFPDLGASLKKLSLGTVDASQLDKKHPDTDFLSDLVKKEAGGANVDGLIFVGPKAMLDSNVPDQDLKSIGDLDYPVFYMNYNPNPQAIPWKDSIGKMVKFFKGREYTITGPRDLWNAVTEMVTRIAKFKQTRGSYATGDGSGR